jgi:hypothetical protein
MSDIGNAERVELMQRLVALEVGAPRPRRGDHRLAEHSGHDQLQLTRLKRRKLLLKDQIGALQRQIDPTSWLIDAGLRLGRHASRICRRSGRCHPSPR